MNDGWNIIVCYSAVFWVALGLYIWRKNRPKYKPSQPSSRPAPTSDTQSQSPIVPSPLSSSSYDLQDSSSSGWDTTSTEYFDYLDEKNRHAGDSLKAFSNLIFDTNFEIKDDDDDDDDDGFDPWKALGF